MEFDEIVVKESPGLCRCCLSEGCYKDMGTEYTWMNENEVYADMLLECFDIGVSFKLLYIYKLIHVQLSSFYDKLFDKLNWTKLHQHICLCAHSKTALPVYAVIINAFECIANLNFLEDIH